MTLGSLFDGIGGFPLAASRHGITPVWASEIEPFCVAVTRRRFPDMIHLGDITKIDGGKIPPVDIITFGSPCFPAGTLVLTDRGYIEIESVKTGMRVLTHKGRWRTVTATGSKVAETVVLRGNHYGLECTPNHPIYSTSEKTVYPHLPNGKRTSRVVITDEKKWVPAGEMTKRLWAVPRSVAPLPIGEPQHADNGRKPMPTMDADFFYFVGRWLGDGWVRNKQCSGRPAGQKWGQIILCDGVSQEETLRRVVSKVSERYNVEHCRTAVKVKFVSQVLCSWLVENFGQYSCGKYIPSWVYSMDPQNRAALLRGIFDTDGSPVKGKENVWRVSTVSKKLAEGLRILGELEGFSTTVHRHTPSPTKILEGRTVRQRPIYIVVFCGDSPLRIKSHWTDDNHSWYRVKSVTPTGERKTVYNLSVDEDNSYVADGIVVHNCQDLSVAGSRAGLVGERSGLFHEAVRIIYEMREATNGAAPTYIVWENVPGAFSSNHGRDFQTVLAEITKTDIPIPRSGRWANAGVVRGRGITFAWRVLDAQYWGVPQRRKRIYAVGSFGSRRAEEILFKPDGLPGNTPQGREARKGAAEDFTRGVGGCHCFDARGNGGGDVTATITGDHANRVNDYMPLVLLNDQGGDSISVEKNDIAPTLRAQSHGNQPIIAYSFGNGQADQIGLSDVARTLNCMHDQQAVMYQSPCYGVDCRNMVNQELYPTLQAHNGGGTSLNFYGAAMLPKAAEYIVRRLTPLECERLQGFPDGWTDIGPWTDDSGKLHKESSDTAKYRAIGNSLAIPCAEKIMRGIKMVSNKHLPSKEATSL